MPIFMAGPGASAAAEYEARGIQGGCASGPVKPVEEDDRFVALRPVELRFLQKVSGRCVLQQRSDADDAWVDVPMVIER